MTVDLHIFQIQSRSQSGAFGVSQITPFLGITPSGAAGLAVRARDWRAEPGTWRPEVESKRGLMRGGMAHNSLHTLCSLPPRGCVRAPIVRAFRLESATAFRRPQPLTKTPKPKAPNPNAPEKAAAAIWSRTLGSRPDFRHRKVVGGCTSGGMDDDKTL